MNQCRRFQKRSAPKFANGAEVGPKILDHANWIPSEAGLQIGNRYHRNMSLPYEVGQIAAKRATDNGLEAFAVEVLKNGQQDAFRAANNASMVQEKNIHRET